MSPQRVATVEAVRVRSGGRHVRSSPFTTVPLQRDLYNVSIDRPSTSRHRNSTLPSKSPNCFILFKNHLIRSGWEGVEPSFMEIQNLTRRAAAKWHSLSDEEKQPWVRLSKKEKASLTLLKATNPELVHRPSHRDSSLHKPERSESIHLPEIYQYPLKDISSSSFTHNLDASSVSNRQITPLHNTNYDDISLCMPSTSPTNPYYLPSCPSGAGSEFSLQTNQSVVDSTYMAGPSHLSADLFYVSNLAQDYYKGNPTHFSQGMHISASSSSLINWAGPVSSNSELSSYSSNQLNLYRAH